MTLKNTANYYFLTILQCKSNYMEIDHEVKTNHCCSRKLCCAFRKLFRVC
jgi:hypothetical protein